MNRYSKSYTVKAGTVLLSTLLLLGSCSEDAIFDDKGGNLGAASDNICFGISDKDGWPETRSARGGETEETVTGNFVLRSADNADTLCVQTTVSDFGPLPFGNNSPMSRAELVTEGNMHDSFGVTACIYTGADKAYYFFNEKNTKPADYSSTAIWKYESGNIYYWPGANHKMRFYAYSPYECEGLTKPENSTAGAAPTFSYTVPANATEQTDILAYATEEMSGDTKASVPLKFNHICTAVQFVVGKEMQPGSITSITLKGVKNAGSYSFESNSWTLDATTANFVQSWKNGEPVSQTEGAEIMGDDGCFVMLPQTLTDGASVEIVFHDNNTGKDRTLTASIAGQQWPQGKRVKYNISISADYELEFTTKPEVQDAHYVIYPITIKADKVPGSSWTLTSNDPTNVTFVEKGKFVSNDVQALVDAGYWLDGYNGADILTSTTTGEVQVYVFLKENATAADRNITLSLKPVAQGNYEAKEFSFEQYCPAWSNGIGVERIQDKDYPWGFNWGSNMKVTYDFMNQSGFSRLLIGWYLNFFSGYKYITVNGVFGSARTVTIDFSKLGSLNTATSTDNGTKNTWEIYNFNGINDASALMNQLEVWGGVADSKLPTNPTEFAARTCAMKNKYKVQIETGQNGTVYRPKLEQADMVWYLPAQNEAPLMDDNLLGDYWTSTAITDPGTTAYKYTAGGSTSPEDRNEVIHVRACRKK